MSITEAQILWWRLAPAANENEAYRIHPRPRDFIERNSARLYIALQHLDEVLILSEYGLPEEQPPYP